VIYDCVMLRDELDMLECRLVELEDYDVTHVIVESFVTHRGEPKPLWYANDQSGRFRKWEHRIRSVAVGEAAFHGLTDPWAREHRQRDAAGLAAVPEPDDMVLIADVDEIPSAAVLTARPATAALIMQRVACFAVDWVWPHLEPTGVLARAEFLNGSSLAGVRDNRHAYPPIMDGGWHLSWMGGHEAHLAKLAAHCHVEQDTPDITGTITSGRAYAEGWHIGTKLAAVDIDETWPRYVRERRCPASWFRPREEQP
jgi:beta-1,4-mannosyl-glycoprotein beta-1,4-N-acetylglucosaminyltransferase